MKRKYFILLLIAFALVTASIPSYLLITKNNSSIPISTIDNIALPEGEKVHLSASYSDGSETISEMMDKAHQIISGSVLEQKQFSDFSVLSTVKVNDTIRGKKFEEIEIYQLGQIGDEELLSKDNEYILFLGLQGKEDENKFYIIGGTQGIFLKDDNSIQAYDIVMKNDLAKKFKENKDKNEVEIFNSIVKGK